MPKKDSATSAGGGDRLSTYRDKRDPAATNEPFSTLGTERAVSSTRGRYAVHLHDASRRHYDLRLEIGGTLASFAVPKGPSLIAGDKRLAVRTEDHPLEYLEFEAVIPEGNYGAGSMILWDHGTVRFFDPPPLEGLKTGKLDFWLQGHKLRGRFALVHTGGRPGVDEKQWLLLKKRDEHSRDDGDVLAEQPHSVLSGLTVEQRARAGEVAAELSSEAEALGVRACALAAADVSPMLCAMSRSAEAELTDPERLYELKLDGVRIVAGKQDEEVELRYRKRRPATLAYPEIARALKSLAPAHVVLDGEIVAFDPEGKPNFQRLARRIHLRRPHDVARASAEVPVTYLVFDLLALEGRDLRGLPLWQRKALLERLLPGKGRIRVLDHLQRDGRALMAFCRTHGLEGVVGKRRDAPYREGPRRTDDWIKLKIERETDLVVVGWDESDKARKLRNLVLAAYDDEGKLRLRGKVGSGLDDATIDHLLSILGPMEIDESAAEGELDRKGPRHWVRPELVASVRYAGMSERGILRFPVFCGLRADVLPTACYLAPTDEVIAHRLEHRAAAQRKPDDGSALRSAEEVAQRVVLTNQDKVFWPATGHTKGDLCDHYATVAPFLLPWLKDRPVVMVRYPDGIEGKSFFQWNAPQGTPDWLRTVAAEDPTLAEGRSRKRMFILDDVDGLLHLANLGCIVLHALGAREGRRDRCDFVTIDFDLPETAFFGDAVRLALTLRELLTDVGLTGFPKTSGQSGLHVLIPTARAELPFEAARQLAELLGRLIVDRHPELATMERTVERRGGKIYVDTGQTGTSRTIVSPYSVRAVPGATVSAPLAWDELSAGLDPARFDLWHVAERLRTDGDLYAGMLDTELDLSAVLPRLAGLVQG